MTSSGQNKGACLWTKKSQCVSSKWRKTEVLMKSGELRKYIPETKKMEYANIEGNAGPVYHGVP